MPGKSAKNPKPKITSIEIDLRRENWGQAWVTVHWGEDNEMQVEVGNVELESLDLERLHEKAAMALSEIAKDIADVPIEPIERPKRVKKASPAKP